LGKRAETAKGTVMAHLKKSIVELKPEENC
jgi:hypothetical protein